MSCAVWLSFFCLCLFPSLLRGDMNPGAVCKDVVARDVHRALSLPHPRLFATEGVFTELRDRIKRDADMRAGAEYVRYIADTILPFPPSQRVLQGKRLLGVSRNVLYRVLHLAMAFRLYGDIRYRDRAVAELRAVAEFSDWNPSHFLDVAEMTTAVAIGYDWLYNELDASTRDVVASAILEKGLDVHRKRKERWVTSANNWGQVCHAGMLAGALALMERNEALAVRIVHRSVTHLPLSMKALAPNGGYPEGPGYWQYGVDFNVLAVELLEGVLRTDYGLSKLPGFRETADYMDLVTGPSGFTFNYADGIMNRGTDCATWWFAKRFERPDILPYFERQAYRRYVASRPRRSPEKAGNRLFPLTLLWLVPETGGVKPHAPLCWSSENTIPISIQRSGWDNKNAFFVGLKGGSPSGPHGHMDGGSFVLDAHGIRWAYDFGLESYNKIESLGMDLWNQRQTSDRWRVFRLNNKSHNTLTINGSLQFVKGKATFLSFHTGEESRAEMDLSSLYTNASRVIRCGTLLSGGRGYRLTDTIQGLSPGDEVRWAMVTRALPEVRGNSVLLKENEKTLTLMTEEPKTTLWRVEEKLQPNFWDNANKGFRQLYFTTIAPKSGELRLSVFFQP